MNITPGTHQSEKSGILRLMNHARRSIVGRVAVATLSIASPVASIGSLIGLANCAGQQPYAPANNYLVGINVPLGTNVDKLPATTVVLPNDDKKTMMLAFGFCSNDAAFIDTMCHMFDGQTISLGSNAMQDVKAFYLAATGLGSLAQIGLVIRGPGNESINVEGGSSVATGGSSVNKNTLEQQQAAKAAADAKNSNTNKITDTNTDTFKPNNDFQPTNTFKPNNDYQPSTTIAPVYKSGQGSGQDNQHGGGGYQNNCGDCTSFNMRIPGYRAARVTLGLS